MRFCEPTKKQERGWRRWVERLPATARAVAERFDPWTLYWLKPAEQRVTLYSVNDNGTLTVTVSGRFNLVLFERQVFGIDPDDLSECDLPAEEEAMGVVAPDLSLDEMRVLVRPDLWVMRDGKAVRKQ